MFEEFNHFFQEASSKTKVTRDKDKIKDDLNYDKSSGMGSITEPTTNRTVDIKLTFNNKQPTEVNAAYRDNDKIIIPMNINPNDLNRGHGFTKYLHEKNHILQDLRKKRIVEYKNGNYSPRLERLGKNDPSDIEAIKAFINKHSSEITSYHSKDPDEYLSDLNVARKKGFNNVIRMLQDLKIKVSKQSPSSKYYKAFIKNASKQNAESYYANDYNLNEAYDQYRDYIKSLENEIELGTYNGNVSSVVNHLEKEIDNIKKHLESKDSFKKFITNEKAVNDLEKLINGYNADIELRIKFLRTMKKLDDKNVGIIEEMCNKDYIKGNSVYSDCIHNIAVNACNNTEALQNEIDEFISEHFESDIVQEYNDDINIGILSYIIMEYINE